MDLKELRRERRNRFTESMLKYTGYIIQSGVAMVFMFALIAFTAWYTALLRNVPEGLPIRWIALALLLPAAVHSGFRTYLQAPDAIFLLPQGQRMKEYFAPAWTSGTIWKSLRLLFVLITLWPLYIRADESPKSLLDTILLLLGVKVLSSYGLWRELAMISRLNAMAFRLLRWGVGGLIAAAWLWQPAGRSLIFIGLLTAAYLAALAVPARHAVPWETLIAAERNQRARALAVLGWFVDIPGQQQRVYRRSLLSRWGNGMPWRKDTAYGYLLTKSFARGDIFGNIIRIGVLGLLLVWWNRDSWLGSGIYWFILFIIGVQLSALFKLHRESFWLTVYPLPEGSRVMGAARLLLRVQLVFAVLLWLPMLAAAGIRPAETAFTLGGGLLLSWGIRSRSVRKAREWDDDE